MMWKWEITQRKRKRVNTFDLWLRRKKIWRERKRKKQNKNERHSLEESWLGDGCMRWRLTRGGGWGLSATRAKSKHATDTWQHKIKFKKHQQDAQQKNNTKTGHRAREGRIRRIKKSFTRRDDQVGLVAGRFIAQRVLLSLDGRRQISDPKGHLSLEWRTLVELRESAKGALPLEQVWSGVRPFDRERIDYRFGRSRRL